jgi:microcystin degradation protein MlrC
VRVAVHADVDLGHLHTKVNEQLNLVATYGTQTDINVHNDKIFTMLGSILESSKSPMSAAINISLTMMLTAKTPTV